MSRPNLQKLGATPAKLALVGLLGIVLLAVVVPQFGSAAATSAQPANQEVSKPQREPVEQPKTNTTTASRPPRKWTLLALEKIVEFDPLAKPQWFLDTQQTAQQDEQIASSDEDREALEELEKLGTSIIVISDRQSAATIGDQQVKIGDFIGGFEVSDITSQGVVLTELHSK